MSSSPTESRHTFPPGRASESTRGSARVPGTSLRTVKFAALFLVASSAVPAFAQIQRGVGLPLKGRQQETGPSPAREPVRKLPRWPAGAALPPTSDPAVPVISLEDYMAELRNMARPREQSDDRLRPLVFGTGTGGDAIPADAYAPRFEPKPPVLTINTVE